MKRSSQSTLMVLFVACYPLPETDGVKPTVVEPPPPDPTPVTPAEVPAPTEWWLRAPAPRRLAPPNLHFIYVEGTPPPKVAPAAIHLQDVEGELELPVVEVVGGQVIARVEERAGRCRWLCPGSEYTLSMPALGPSPASQGEVVTGTVADRWPPILTSTAVIQVGDALELDVFADEPVVVRGDVRDRTGLTVPMVAAPLAGPQVRLRPASPLPPKTDVIFTLFTEDLAGNAGPIVTLSAQTPAHLDVRIQEVVPTALHDWGDSEGGIGVPFDPWPGVGPVSSTDEWVELVNRGDEPIDLYRTRVELRGLDGTPVLTSIAGAPALYFGSGGSRLGWWPGEALVVRTRGDLSQRGLTVAVWAGRRELDRVQIGLGAGEDHPGGSPPDPERESIARTVSGRWKWCAPTPGDPLPNGDCP